MSCYLRHLRAELEQAGIVFDEESRKKLDQAIHRVVGVEYKDCPKAWKGVKARMASDKKAFMAKVKKELEEA
ncbi:MAG: hypothetical protein LUQ16_06595 [Methanomassiliicoccales archaeon]|nr:hypothetical protein [Methanomassiliicoccales archaeon]